MEEATPRELGIAKLNQGFAELFSRDRSNEYDRIGCLVMHWKELEPGEEGFRTEAVAVRDFFKRRLHYSATIYEIPSQNCQHAVRRKVHEFLEEFMGQNDLAIIHYGGHGDEDAKKGEDGRPQRRGVWARTSKKSDTEGVVDWSDIQPSLRDSKGHVLVLLDCCYAGQSARATETVIPSNVELQAACAMNVTTVGPGPWSFSMAWLRVAEEMLSQKGHITIAEMHHALSTRENRLQDGPQHWPLQRGKRTIRLEPLYSVHERKLNQDATAVMLQLKIMTRGPLDDSLLEDFHEWVKEYAPRRIVSMQATQLALDLKDFITQSRGRTQSRTTMKAMDPSSRAHIRSIWGAFTGNVIGALRTLALGVSVDGGNESITEEKRVEQFLNEFNDNVQAVQRVVERGVISLPALQKHDAILQSLRDPALQQLGIAETLRIRLLCEDSQHDDFCLKDKGVGLGTLQIPAVQSPLMEHYDSTFGEILVEYKRYDAGIEEAYRKDCESKVNRLAGVLQSALPATYHTPKCLGWLHEEKHSRFVLVFAKPDPERHGPITLREIIDYHNGSSEHRPSPGIKQPSLGERFLIARKLGEALLKWHTAGWVHQGIGSHNVVFLQNPDGSVEYSEPYLCGFEFSRRTSDLSRDKHLYHTDFQIYQHPERQGLIPATRHTKKHDIYSFGLLLVEIALWDSIPSLFQSSIDKRGLSAVQKLVIHHMHQRQRLGHAMGGPYEAATMVCLKGNFDTIVEENDIKLELAREFERKVLGELAADPTRARL
jgi:hypothetical protein